MPLRRDSGADARSRETEFSGLPKAAKLIAQNQGAPGAGNVAIAWSGLLFNYGPFTPRAGGGGYDALTVHEPGVYEIMAQLSVIANSQTMAAFIAVNGSATMRDTTISMSYTGATLSNGAFVPSYNFHMFVELLAGDYIQVFYSQATAGAQVGLGGYTWMYAEKRGGRY